MLYGKAVRFQFTKLLFKRGNTRKKRGGIRIGFGRTKADKRGFGFDPPVLRTLHGFRSRRENAQAMEYLLFCKKRCHMLHTLHLVIGADDKLLRRFHGFYYKVISELVYKLVHKALRVAGRIVKLIQKSKALRNIPFGNGFDELIYAVLPDKSRGVRHNRARDIVGHAHCPIEQRKRVTHSAVGYSRNKNCRVAVKHGVFALCYIHEPVGNDIGLYPAEIEPLAARQNGGGQLMNFGRGKDKLDMLRGFFERFEKRIERLNREHMNLVYYVDAVLRLRRSEIRLVP